MDQKDSFLRDSCARRLHRQWQVQSWYCWFYTPVVFFPLVVDRPEMLGIMASMDQKDSVSSTSWQWRMQGWFCWFRSSRCVSPISCRGAEVDFHGLAFKQTKVLPLLQFLYEVVDVPGMQVVQVIPSRCPLCNDRCPPQRSSSSWSCKISLSWCRGRFPWSCCSADHTNSPVARGQGGRCPYVACAWLVLWVTIPFTLCSLLSFTGP